MSGLSHYARRGYKGAHVGGADGVAADLSRGSAAGWAAAPYRFRQARTMTLYT